GSRFFFLRALGSTFGFSTLGRILATPAAREAWEWVDTLSLVEAGDRLLADVVRSPEFAQIVVLTADAVGPGGTAVLAESPYVMRLRLLVLNGCLVGPDGARALAVSPRLAGLNELHLRMCGIGDEGAQ